MSTAPYSLNATEAREEPLETGPRELASILIVDDSETKLLALETILAELGQRIVTARSGSEALRHLLTDDFAVILLDVHMPGFDGFETAKLIRKRKRSEHTPIIFISAISPAEAYASRAYALGAVDYIFSPIDPGILRAKVGVFVDLHDQSIHIRRQAERIRELELHEHRRQLADASERLSLALAAGGMRAWEWDLLTEPCVLPPAGGAGMRGAEVLEFDRFPENVFAADYARVMNALKESLATGEDFSVEFRADRADGQTRWLEIRGRPLRRPGRTSSRVIGVAADVTERKRVEEELQRHRKELEQLVTERTEQLRRAERLASIGTLAAGIAHEINNPLNAILMTAECAIRCGSENDVGELLNVIRAEAQRGGRIIKGILRFSRNENSQKTPGDLNAVVRHAAELSRIYVNRPNLELALRLTADLPPVNMNTTEMEQVVVNLIKNAAEATGAALTVTVATACSDAEALVTVADNGPGIPPDVLWRVFDPFFSTKRNSGGTGLGLSICHGIVQEHGGTIRVHSDPGSGTRFEIRLPVVADGTSGDFRHGEDSAPGRQPGFGQIARNDSAPRGA